MIANSMTLVAVLAGGFSAEQAEREFDRLREATVRRAEALHARKDVPALSSLIQQPQTRSDATRAKRHLALRPLASVSLAGIEPAVATNVERLSAAISTKLDGVEAGVAISPAVIRGAEGLAEWNLIGASLADDVTRFGVRWSKEWLQLRLEDVRCKMPEGYDQNLRSLRGPYLRVCTLAFLLEPRQEGADAAAYNRDLREARAACGGPEVDRSFVPDELEQAIGALNAIVTHAQESGDAEISQRAADLSIEAQEIKDKYAFPIGTECVNEEGLKAYWKERLWNATRLRAGATVLWDHFPSVSGLNPEAPAPLPNGNLKQRQLQIEGSLEKRRLGLAISLGLSRAREKSQDDTLGSWQSAFTLSWNLGGLGEALVGNDDRLNLKKADLPPHWVLGFTFKGSRARDLAEKQTTAWNSYELLPFLDFKISEKLAFRIGAPFKAGLKAKKDAKGDVEVRDLQTTRSAFFATVVKL